MSTASVIGDRLFEDLSRGHLARAGLNDILATSRTLARRIALDGDLDFVGAYMVAHRDGLAYPEVAEGRDVPSEALEPIPISERRNTAVLISKVFPKARFMTAPILSREGTEQGRVVAIGRKRHSTKLQAQLTLMADWLTQAWANMGTLRNSLEARSAASVRGDWYEVAKESVRWLRKQTGLKVAVGRVDFAYARLQWVAGSDNCIVPGWTESVDGFPQRELPFRYSLRDEPRVSNLGVPLSRLTDGAVFAYLFCSAAERESRQYMAATDVRLCRWVGDQLVHRHQLLLQQHRIDIVLAVLSESLTGEQETREAALRGIQHTLNSQCTHIFEISRPTAPYLLAESHAIQLQIGPSAPSLKNESFVNDSLDAHHSVMKSSLFVRAEAAGTSLLSCSFSPIAGAFHDREVWAVKALLDHLALAERIHQVTERSERLEQENRSVKQSLDTERIRIELAQQAIQNVHFARHRADQIEYAVDQASAAVSRVRNPRLRGTLRSAIRTAQQQLSWLTRTVEAIRLRTPEDYTVFDVRQIVKEIARMQITVPGDLAVMATGRPGPEAQLLAPRRTLLFLVENLVRNAVESGARGVIVGSQLVPEGEVEYVRLYVKDNGERIPSEIQKTIWAMTFSSKERGSGLGLADTKAFAEKNGGSVGFDAEPGWKTFWLDLPRWRKPSA